MFYKTLKTTNLQSSKIQGTYFKICALYFKIYGLYFLLFGASENQQLTKAQKKGFPRHGKRRFYAALFPAHAAPLI